MRLYAVRNKDTGKLVKGLTNPSRKFWEVRKYCEDAIKRCTALELNSLARIDFFYHDDKIYLNEINTLPGFTEISMYPQLFEYENISIKELITTLLNNN